MDDSAFVLATQGFFGAAVRKKSKELQEFKYKSRFRKKAIFSRNLIYKLYFLSLCSTFAFFVVGQRLRFIGVYNEVYLQFDDSEGPDLFGISGAYIGCHGFGTRRTGSVGYFEASYDNCPEKLDKEFPANAFYFCKGKQGVDEGWVFVKNPTEDPCSNYTIRSFLTPEERKDSDYFDILSYADADWLYRRPEIGLEAFLDWHFIQAADSIQTSYNCTGQMQFVGELLLDESRLSYSKSLPPLPNEYYHTFGRKSKSSYSDKFGLVYRQVFLGEANFTKDYSSGGKFPAQPRCDVEGSDYSTWSILMYDGLSWHYMQNFNPRIFVDHAARKFADVDQEECAFKVFLKYYLRDKSWMFNRTIVSPNLVSAPVLLQTPDDKGLPTRELEWYDVDIHYSRPDILPGRSTQEEHATATVWNAQTTCKEKIECAANEILFDLDLLTPSFPEHTTVAMFRYPPIPNPNLEEYRNDSSRFYGDFFANMMESDLIPIQNKIVSVEETISIFSLSESVLTLFRFCDRETRYRLVSCVPFELGTFFVVDVYILSSSGPGLVEFELGFGGFLERSSADELVDCLVYPVFSTGIENQSDAGKVIKPVRKCTFDDTAALYPELNTQKDSDSDAK